MSKAGLALLLSALQEFQEQKFFPLLHVVDIFSSGDPQAHTAEVGEARSMHFRHAGQGYAFKTLDIRL